MNGLSKTLGTVLMVVVACGCSSSSDEGPGGSGSEPSSASPSSPASESETVTDDVTEDPTDAVAPATGPVIKIKGIRANIPAGWSAGRRSAIQDYGFFPTQVGTDVEVFRFPQLLIESLDELTRNNAKRSGGDRPLERLADVTVDGQVVSHLSGMPTQGVHVELFSTLRDRQQLELKFTFGTGESKAEREEIVQSVLASVQFKP